MTDDKEQESPVVLIEKFKAIRRYVEHLDFKFNYYTIEVSKLSTDGTDENLAKALDRINEILDVVYSASPSTVMFRQDLQAIENRYKNELEAVRQQIGDAISKAKTKVIECRRSNDRPGMIEAIREELNLIREAFEVYILFPKRLLKEVQAKLNYADSALRVEEPAPSVIQSNRFKKNDETWEIVLNGESNSLVDSRGLFYIRQLLMNPGREFSGEQMVNLFRSHQEGSRSSVSDLENYSYENELSTTSGRRSSSDPVLDEEAKKEYDMRLGQIIKQREDAEELQNWDEIAKLDEEAARIQAVYRAAITPGGRDRQMTSDQKRHHDSVQKAIKRALTRIKSHFPKEGKEFSLRINTDGSFFYTESSVDFVDL